MQPPVSNSTSITLSAELEAVLVDGPADIQLRLTTREMGRTNSDVQGLSLIQLWVGTLTSDWIRFPGDCHPDR